VQRFERSDLDNSDVYRVNAGLERTLTRQLRGRVGYEFAYFDIEHEDKVTTHTPRIGATWQVTPTITVAASAGPSFEEHESGASRITPAATVTYDQKMWFGAIGAGFDRQIATAGGLGGVTDNTSISGRVDVITLMRGLTVSFLPRYSWVKSGNSSRIDISSITLPLQVTYRITAWMAAVARYQFYQQRTASEVRDTAGNLLAADADQNRVFVGLQFGYPITFDRP
jgi:long-subunit fatty acid transport protein